MEYCAADDGARFWRKTAPSPTCSAEMDDQNKGATGFAVSPSLLFRENGAVPATFSVRGWVK